MPFSYLKTDLIYILYIGSKGPKCQKQFVGLSICSKNVLNNYPQEIEYIMMTGDNPPHDVWLQSREGNLDHSRKVVELINKVFPDKQVIYTLGNHESFPCNRFGKIFTFFVFLLLLLLLFCCYYCCCCCLMKIVK